LKEEARLKETVLEEELQDYQHRYGIRDNVKGKRGKWKKGKLGK
jgi:hypothetical protein